MFAWYQQYILGLGSSQHNFYRCHANCIDGKYHQFRQIASALCEASTDVSDKKLALANVVSAFDSVFAEVLRNSLLERSALPFSQWARRSEENGNYDVIHCLLLRSAIRHKCVVAQAVR